MPPRVHTATTVRTAALAIALALGLGHAAPARAEDGLRCGSDLVFVGASADDVAKKCGPPTTAARRIARRRHMRATIDVWTYDRGPHELVRTLTFVDGVLQTIELGGYGSARR